MLVALNSVYSLKPPVAYSAKALLGDAQITCHIRDRYLVQVLGMSIYQISIAIFSRSSQGIDQPALQHSHIASKKEIHSGEVSFLLHFLFKIMPAAHGNLSTSYSHNRKISAACAKKRGRVCVNITGECKAKNKFAVIESANGFKNAFCDIKKEIISSIRRHDRLQPLHVPRLANFM